MDLATVLEAVVIVVVAADTRLLGRRKTVPARAKEST